MTIQRTIKTDLTSVRVKNGADEAVRSLDPPFRRNSESF